MSSRRTALALRSIAQAAELALDAGDDVVARLDAELDPADPSWSYLILGVMRGRIPAADEVVAFSRGWQLDGLRAALRELRRAGGIGRGRPPEIVGGVLVDLTDTSQASYTTGIQRVARETASRWHEGEVLTEVRFDHGRSSLRAYRDDNRLVLPFAARFVLPEIAVERTRSRAITSIARFSKSSTLAIGFDCIPLTTAETCGPGMPGEFAHYLTALAHFDVVAPISVAAGDEFRGWRDMLVGTGIDGPRIHDVELPYAAGEPNGASARQELQIADEEPLLIAVGSHEPRKNHVRLLEACELVWRAGARFTLVMVGGNAWNTGRFEALLTRLRDAGRPIVTRSAVTDGLVWSLYQDATASAFVSLNEGFGLPLAESLAAGTPAVTSQFGSMAALGGGRGAILVDPRSPRGIADALTSVLTDESTRERLAAEAVTPERGWDRYASEVLALVPAAVDRVSRPQRGSEA